MAKTPLEFFNKYNGKVIDYDGAYGAQCVDGFKVFCKWADIPVKATPNGWADGYWIYRVKMGYADWFDFITDPKEFRTGDWIFWKRKSKSHPNSHVAMFYHDKEFGENQGGNRGFRLKNTDFSDAAGAFRWHGFMEDPLNQFTDDQLADRVIQGMYGNGTERQRLLGDRYDAVQKLVNAKLHKKKAVYYTVQKGDTLIKIAKAFHTPLQQILTWNPNIKDPDKIYPGQRFRVG